MFGIKYLKAHPTDYVLQYRRGKLTREGAGQAFYYFAPFTSLVKIPLASVDVPFIYEAVTADFQEITLQGVLTYRVSDPKKLSTVMNFTLTPQGDDYASEDPQKLPIRLINLTQELTSSLMKTMELREALIGIEAIVQTLRSGLQGADIISLLGIEVLGLSILAIKPTPDTARALEAEAREQMLREADEAIYARRNAAVEQERNIKENELNTEIAVEEKKRQIRETKMEAEKSVQQKKRELEEAKMSTRIGLEEMNKEYTRLAAENAREQADAKAYAVSAMTKPISNLDPKVLQALTNAGMDSGQLISLAFKELAESAEKIGQLNISPELLNALLASRTDVE
jgi:regulator of protease activity HflC (stomatin/prohibitin superfamily)